MSYSVNWACNLGSNQMDMEAAEIKSLREKVGKRIRKGKKKR
jgi:hypothetical protein